MYLQNNKRNVIYTVNVNKNYMGHYKIILTRNVILILLLIIIVFACNKNLDSALINASKNGNSAKVQQIIDNYEVSDESKEEALFIASGKDFVDIVKALIEDDVNVNKLDEETNISSLYIASLFGHIPTMKILISAGADPRIDDKNGMSILANNLFASSVFIEEELEKGGKIPEWRLKKDVAQIQIEMINLLVDAGADINASGVEGMTPLLSSILLCEDNVINALIDSGAEVNGRDKKIGMTALMIAARAGQVSKVNLLIDAGADVNASTYGGETALSLAIDKNSHAVVKILIKSGATT